MNIICYYLRYHFCVQNQEILRASCFVGIIITSAWIWTKFVHLNYRKCEIDIFKLMVSSIRRKKMIHSQSLGFRQEVLSAGWFALQFSYAGCNYSAIKVFLAILLNWNNGWTYEQFWHVHSAFSKHLSSIINSWPSFQLYT